MRTSLAELGEFGVIARLAAALSFSPDVLVGIGDDAAFLDTGGGDPFPLALAASIRH